MVLTEQQCKISMVCMTGLLMALCGCQGLKDGTPTGSNPGVASINHIIFMAQENRSFDP